jgi:hypothetical protein
MSTRIVGMTAGAAKRPRKSPANPLGKSLGRVHAGSS